MLPEVGWWWLLTTSAPTKQKNVHKLISQPATLSLKILPWKPRWSLGLLDPNSCLHAQPQTLGVPCNKGCTFPHHNSVSTDWLYYNRADRPKFNSVTHTHTHTHTHTSVSIYKSTHIHTHTLRNGIFPAISVNKGRHSHHWLQPPQKVSWWALRELRKEAPVA